MCVCVCVYVCVCMCVCMYVYMYIYRYIYIYIYIYHLRQEYHNSKFGIFELLAWKETFADALLTGIVS